MTVEQLIPNKSIRMRVVEWKEKHPEGRQKRMNTAPVQVWEGDDTRGGREVEDTVCQMFFLGACGLGVRNRRPNLIVFLLSD